jgi:hypothetical protein
LLSDVAGRPRRWRDLFVGGGCVPEFEIAVFCLNQAATLSGNHIGRFAMRI